MKTTTRKYYNFIEFIKYYMEDWDKELAAGVVINNYLYNLAEAVFPDVEFPADAAVRSPIANKLFCSFIAPSFKYYYIAYKDCGDDETTDQELFEDFFSTFLLVLNDTFDKYNVILTNYTNSRESLMDDIKVSSEVKYNNTPQNAQGTYDWSDDDHLTNVSRSETNNPMATKIARLDEINNLLRLYYTEWRNKFCAIMIPNI